MVSPNAGAVDVLHGSSRGISSYGSQEWHQNSPGIEGEAERGDRLGWLDF